MKVFFYITFFVFFFLIGFLVIKKNDQPINIKRTQIILGTFVEVEVIDDNEEEANQAINSSFSEMKRIDSLFSVYNINSEISRINSGKDSLIKIDQEVFNLLKSAEYYWEISGGAFDPALGSLMEEWKFYTENPSIPIEKNLHLSLQNSGQKNVKFLKNNRLQKILPVKFDLGGIAKGYAVDKAIDKLKEAGIEKGLVNAGGDVKGFGIKWRIGVQHPRKENNIVSFIELDEMAAATSGDYEKYFIKNGKRFHHILNPETGYPAEKCQSVTVISKSAAEADALSTALFVLGPTEGMKLIESIPGVEAVIIDSTGNIIFSSGF